MFPKRFFLFPMLLVGLLIGGGVFAAVNHSRWDDEGPTVIQVTSPSGDTAATTPQVIEVHDRGWGHRGFFPFFFLFPVLFFLLIFWVIGGIFRGAWHGGPGEHGHGRWNERFEEWHREQHRGDVPPTTTSSA